MIKTVTSGKWLTYQEPRRLAVPDYFEPKLIKHLLALSTSGSPLAERDIACEVGYSLPHFRRLAQAVLGESAHSFVLRLRLERAAMRIAAGQTVAASASGASFESREAFARAFASHFGCAPSEFQRLNRNVALEFPAASGDLEGKSVKVRAADSAYTTFLYDGLILLGRTFSDGRLDWRSTFRRDSRRIS